VTLEIWCFSFCILFGIHKRYTETIYFGKIDGSLQGFCLKTQARQLGLSPRVADAFVKRFKKFTSTTPLTFRKDQQTTLKAEQAIALPIGLVMGSGRTLG